MKTFKKSIILFFIALGCFLFAGCTSKTLESLVLDVTQVKTSYQLNEDFVSTGLKVSAVYSDESKEEVTGFSVDSSAFDKTVAGTYTIVVKFTYEDVEKSASFDVTVQAAAVTFSSLELNTENVKLKYFLGEEFTSENLVVKAKFSDGSSETITDFTVNSTNFNSDVKGEYSISVRATVDNVARIEYYVVTVSGTLDEVNYIVGLDVFFKEEDVETEAVYKVFSRVNETYDYSDVVVKAVYADGTKKVLAADEYTMNISKVDLTKRGSYEVSFSATESYNIEGLEDPISLTEDTFFLVLVENVVTSITLRSGTTTFAFEDGFSGADWVFELTYADGTKEEVAYDDVNVTGLESTSGSHVATVKYSQEQIAEVADVEVTLEVPYIISEAAGPAPTNYVLNANDMTIGDITTNLDVVPGVLTIMATSDSKVTVEANSKTIDGFTFTNRIKLNGTGKVDSRSIKITVDSAATVTIYSQSGSSSEDRTLQLYDSSFTAVAGQTGTALGASISKCTIEVPAAGTYYIGSTSKSINLYYVEVTVVTSSEVAHTFSVNDLSATGVTDKDPLAAGTTFDKGYFTIFGEVVQRLNSAKTAVSSIEVGKAGASGITFTITGTAKVTIEMSSTGGGNSSAVGIVKADGTNVANTEGITTVSGTTKTTMTYELEAGTYSVISPADATLNRGARLYSINVLETILG